MIFKGLKLATTICCSVVVARWIYAEAELVLPSAVPVIDYALENVRIPTHDTWPKEKLYQFVEQITEGADQAAKNF